MMIVRAAPHTARAEDQNTEHGHEPFGEPGVRQNRAVLLVVVDDEQAQEEEARQKTANDFAGKINVPNRSSHGQGEQERGGGNVHPAFRREINRVRFGR
jgi:hypothetical protein